MVVDHTIITDKSKNRRSILPNDGSLQFYTFNTVDWLRKPRQQAISSIWYPCSRAGWVYTASVLRKLEQLSFFEIQKHRENSVM